MVCSRILRVTLINTPSAYRYVARFGRDRQRQDRGWPSERAQAPRPVIGVRTEKRGKLMFVQVDQRGGAPEPRKRKAIDEDLSPRMRQRLGSRVPAVTLIEREDDGPFGGRMYGRSSLGYISCPPN